MELYARHLVTEGEIRQATGAKGFGAGGKSSGAADDAVRVPVAAPLEWVEPVVLA